MRDLGMPLRSSISQTGTPWLIKLPPKHRLARADVFSQPESALSRAGYMAAVTARLANGEAAIAHGTCGSSTQAASFSSRQYLYVLP